MNRMLGTMMVLGALLGPSLAAAQNITGQVEGVVSDAATGKPLQGATVAITSPTGAWIEQSVTTDGSGYFAVTALPPGHYQLTVLAQGYAPTSEQDLQVMVDYRIRANQRLAPHAASAEATAGAVAVAGTR